MPVPSQEYDSCCPLVWCVFLFDFAIWLGTFRLEFFLEFSIFVILLFACFYVTCNEKVWYILIANQRPNAVDVSNYRSSFILQKWAILFVFILYVFILPTLDTLCVSPAIVLFLGLCQERKVHLGVLSPVFFPSQSKESIHFFDLQLS